MTYVYDFTEGDKDQKDLLGGKGANLAEMTNLGPPGAAGVHDLDRGLPRLPRGRRPARRARRRDRRAPAPPSRRRWDAGSATPGDPLLVSVRSGAEGLDARDDGDGPQRRSQRRVGARPGRAERRRAVRDGLLPPAAPDVRRHGARHRVRGLLPGARPAEEGPRHRVRHRPRRRRPARPGRRPSSRPSTSTPAATSRRTRASSSTSAMRAVFDSWNTERAALYRRQERIAEGLGTAVNVQAMVFGNRGDDSGSGVAFTRDPASGNQGVYGDYLQNAQGEDVVAGIRNTVSLADMERDRQDVARRAARDHGDAREALPRHVRHRVHRRARQALDAPDPGRQAHPRGGVPDRPAHDRRGPDRHRRGAAPGDRRPARAADVPALRREGRAHPARQGHERLPRCRRRQGRLRLRHRRRVGRARRGRDPGPQGDQPRRPARHGRRHAASSPAAAARPPTRPWSRAAWAAPASAASRRST